MRPLRAAALAAFFAAVPAALAAQQTSGAYVVRKGQDTIAVDRFTRGPTELKGEVVDRLAGFRQTYDAKLNADGTISRFALEVRPARAPADSPPAQKIAIELRGDSAFLYTGDATTPARSMATPAGTLPFFNLYFSLVDQATRRAHELGGGTLRIPLLMQSLQTVDGSYAPVGGDSATLTIGGTTLRVALDDQGRMLGGVVPAQQLTIERVAASEASTKVAPTDYSAPPGAPYTAEAVSVPGPAGTLAGTLTMPKDARGPVPAIVTITGSGPEDRDEALPSVGPYRPFRQIADTLSRRGIAVLRMDDRGFGESQGDLKGTSADFADDIRAAVRYLRSRQDIDGARIALLGHSEGGMIAPMVAATDPHLRGIILMAGPGRSGRFILHYQLSALIENDTSLTAAARDSALKRVDAKIDSAAAASPWTRFFVDYDPLPTARKVRVPVLILQGATDHQVFPDQAPLLARAFRAGGDHDVTLKVFPNLNHLFVPDPSGLPEGYTRLPSFQVERDVLGTIADWAVQHLE